MPGRFFAGRKGVFAGFFSRSGLLAAIIGLTLVGTAIGLTRPVATVRAAPTPRPRAMTLGVLLQRERADGSWGRVECVGKRHCVRARDALQLTVQLAQPGFLLVAARSAGQVQVLYPLVGQRGAARAGWAYALPGPSEHYLLDGQRTQFVVVVGGEPWPESEAARRAVVHAAVQHEVRSNPRPPVVLPLRDGTPVRVPVRHFEASGLVVALVDLG